MKEKFKTIRERIRENDKFIGLCDEFRARGVDPVAFLEAMIFSHKTGYKQGFEDGRDGKASKLEGE